MQYLRGFIYFKNKNLSEVLLNLKDFHINDCKTNFFKKITVDKKLINSPGVLLDGSVNVKYTIFDIVKTFRKIMGLNVGVIDCSLSLGSLNKINILKTGVVRGFFTSFYFDNKEFYSEVVGDILKESCFNSVVARQSGDKNNMGWCLDLITDYIFNEDDVVQCLENKKIKISKSYKFKIL